MSRTITADEAYEDIRNALGEDLCSLLDEDGWSDIMINPDGSVWIDKDEMIQVNCSFTERGLNSAALTLANYTNQQYNGTEQQSLIAIVPKMNLRSIFINRPAVTQTSAIFRRPSQKLIELNTLVDWGTITATQFDFLQDAIRKHKNIVISGGTGSGKTTIMNSIMTLIDNEERLVIVEDTPELVVAQPNKLLIRVNDEYPYSKAIADALRARPTRIIIGECRKGDQTLQMLKAWNTGHPGGLTTLHANSANDVITRMEQLCGEVSVSSQRSMIESVVDVIIQMQRLDGSRRKATEVRDVRNNKNVE